MTNTTRRNALMIAFSSVSLVLLGTVSVQFEAMDAYVLSRPGRQIVKVTATGSLNKRQMLQIERSRRAADRKNEKKTESRVRLTPRFLRSATGAAILHGASESSVIRVYERAGCGDGLVLETEECDDKNTKSGDGCSSACKRETGFTCNSSQPTVCWDRCGDGLVSANDECDDGNTANGDGCNQYCNVEPGYTCTTATPNICTFDEE